MLVAALLAVLSASSIAEARRAALVIGNSAYQHTTPLKNPRNDAGDIAAELQRLGFEVVTGLDLDKAGMESALRTFARTLTGVELAVFFYAGHALQVSGRNYLVPTDARLETETDVEFDTVSLHMVLRHMERQALNSLILLDACRDNPLARRLRGLARSTQFGQGLADVAGEGVDVLIGFSTKPGSVALDGDGRNSPYAGALLRHMRTPGDEVITTLRRVRNDVYDATAGRQAPWDHNSLRHAVFFNPGRSAPVPPSARPAGPRVISFRQDWSDGKVTLGSFKRIDDRRWLELVQSSSEARATTFDFEQLSSSPTSIVLHDPDRSTEPIWVRIELAEKRVYWSSDSQRTWNYIYAITDME
jgi:uncharacterized caspase-like protein